MIIAGYAFRRCLLRMVDGRSVIFPLPLILSFRLRLRAVEIVSAMTEFVVGSVRGDFSFVQRCQGS